MSGDRPPIGYAREIWAVQLPENYGAYRKALAENFDVSASYEPYKQGLPRDRSGEYINPTQEQQEAAVWRTLSGRMARRLGFDEIDSVEESIADVIVIFKHSAKDNGRSGHTKSAEVAT